MKKFVFVFTIFAVFGCAKVNLQTSQPIKLDINMRVDVYQHVAKDIDDIENIVSGSNKQAQPKEGQSMLNYFIASVYAEDGLSPEVENAALRRKARFSEVTSLQEKGTIGENRLGLLEIKANGNSSLEKFVKEENDDRMIIYRGIAAKNGTTVSEVQKLYAKKLQENAPGGTPLEAASGEWKVK